MYDAAGQASYRLEVGLEKQGDRQIVTVTADRNWLAAPDREYPVIVTPAC